MCATCTTRSAATTATPVGHPQVAPAALAGVAAAAVAAGAWFGVVALTSFQVGVLAVAVGWLVGRAVVLGGRGRGGALQGIAVALTLLSMALAEHLISWHFANEYFIAEGLGPVPLLLPLADVVAVIGDSLAADPLTLVFWLLALATAWRVAGPARQA